MENIAEIAEEKREEEQAEQEQKGLGDINEVIDNNEVEGNLYNEDSILNQKLDAAREALDDNTLEEDLEEELIDEMVNDAEGKSNFDDGYYDDA